jgi:uncharacterized protein YdiU (UPF0061 family)
MPFTPAGSTARSTAVGRYAYGNQPRIAQWSLSRMAQSLRPLFDEEPDKASEEAQGAIDGVPERL